MLTALTEPKFRKAALRRSGRAAMNPMLLAARSNAPILQDSVRNPDAKRNLLKSDIKMSSRVNIEPSTHKKSGKIRKGSKHELSVMIKTSKKTEDYALVVEYGRDEFVFITSDVVFGKKVRQHTKTSPAFKAQPFMRPALYDNRDAAFRIFRNTLAKEIASQIKKQGKYWAKQNNPK